MDGGGRRAVKSSAHEHTRELTWGQPANREFVGRLATDMALRSGFEVCVIEVVRADALVECIAVHGAPVGSVKQVGHVRELARITRSTPGMLTHGDLTFFTGGQARKATRDGLNGAIPGPRSGAESLDWVTGDRIMVRLRDERQTLRALVQLGGPIDGRRPDSKDLRRLSEELQLSFRSLLLALEHEGLAHQVRLERAVRRVLRAASDDTVPADLVQLVRSQMRQGFRASELFIHLFDADDFPSAADNDLSPELFRALLEATRRAWARDDIVIVEGAEVWGDEILQRDHAAEIKRRFAEDKVGSLVLVPVGDRSNLLGTMTIIRPPDGPRWTESESAAALDAGRDLGHAFCNARAFEREQRVNLELRRLGAYRTELISTLSHELRNPIGVIQGHLEMLNERSDLDAVVHRSLSAITRSAERLDALSRDLLALRVLDDPDHPVRHARVDLLDVVREVVDLAQVDAARAGVTLEVGGPHDRVEVLGDRDELSQVVTNLASNALKYSDPGGLVRLEVVRQGDQIVLACVDNGIGISAEDQDKLFREFFRSTNFDALRRPGNGLGLSIVQRIVARHGGTIRVDSKLGEGTTFSVVLPCPE